MTESSDIFAVMVSLNTSPPCNQMYINVRQYKTQKKHMFINAITLTGSTEYLKYAEKSKFYIRMRKISVSQ